jgi:hypothetical protein
MRKRGIFLGSLGKCSKKCNELALGKVSQYGEGLLKELARGLLLLNVYAVYLV